MNRQQCASVPEEYGPSAKLDVLRLVYQYRLTGHIDRANRLELLVDKLIQGLTVLIC